MKENIITSSLAAKHSILWHATFLLQLHEPHLPQTVGIIHSNTCITINSLDDLGIVKQITSTLQWRYPFLVIYKHLAYLQAMFYALFLEFNKI